MSAGRFAPINALADKVLKGEATSKEVELLARNVKGLVATTASAAMNTWDGYAMAAVGTHRLSSEDEPEVVARNAARIADACLLERKRRFEPDQGEAERDPPRDPPEAA
jgi:hypothetical protein